MAPKKTRQRQLQRLAERRAAERRRHRRRRILAGVVALAVAVGGSGFAAYAFLAGGGDAGTATDTMPTASPPEPETESEPMPNPPPQPAPEQVACDGEVPPAAGEEKPTFPEPPPPEIDPSRTYTATMKTSCGDITLRLFADRTPVTVNNFVFLSRVGFYDGTYFHRIIEGFMNQGGDPTGTGGGGPGYQFEDEFVEELRFDKQGLLAMANAGPGTNGSQFFITVGTPTHLNDRHTIFGEVVEGHGVVKRINQVPTGSEDRPNVAVYIESITIEES